MSGLQERWGAVTDRDAQRRFAEVVAPHLDDAYALARWLAGNGADAEDIVQEAALRAYRAISGFVSGNERAWMLTIVRNCAYTWLRRNRPKAMVFTEDVEAAERGAIEALGSPEFATPETELIARQDGTRVRAAIESLPLPFREALVLREAQGLAYREIAEVMGLPIGTVMSRLARARKLLFEALKEVA